MDAFDLIQLDAGYLSLRQLFKLHNMSDPEFLSLGCVDVDVDLLQRLPQIIDVLWQFLLGVDIPNIEALNDLVHCRHEVLPVIVDAGQPVHGILVHPIEVLQVLKLLLEVVQKLLVVESADLFLLRLTLLLELPDLLALRQ